MFVYRMLIILEQIVNLRKLFTLGRRECVTTHLQLHMIVDDHIGQLYLSFRLKICK